jgi:2,5-diamino-6-(ribosylamino)-4(3H)-pyrimidinone 5'-phosphate reductase
MRLMIEDVYRDIFSSTHSLERPYVVINMVVSLDGKVTVQGKASSIGSSMDRTLMRNLRAQVDAVMVGAGTLRAEKLRLDVPEELAGERASRELEPQPLGVIVAGSGDVPLPRNLVTSSFDNLLILVSSEEPLKEGFGALASRASVEVVPRQITSGSQLDLGRALETLKERYAVEVLLVEGGPTLNHALICAGLVDELFLTLAPKLLGGVRPGALTILEGLDVPPQKSPSPELVSVHLFDDELFLRYTLHPPGRPVGG